MYLLAASRLSKEKVRSELGHRYFKEILRLLTIANTHSKKKDASLLQQRPIQNMLYIVITPNQGFCGGLPSNINRLAVFSAEEQQNHITEDTGRNPPTVGYITVGKKGRDFFTRTNRKLLRTYINAEPTWALASELTHIIVELFQREDFDAVFIVYAHSDLLISKPVVEQLLPVNPSLLQAQIPPDTAIDEDRYSEEYILYFFAPRVELIFPRLILQYLVCQIYVALLEGAKSENNARMIAMKQATERAKETLDHLTVVYNVARQAQITADLLEIVSASEALREEFFS